MVARYRKHGPKPPSLTRGEVNRVLDQLDQLDAARRELEDRHAMLMVVLFREKHERVREAFEAFHTAGGVGGDDWLDFLNGQPMRGCTQRQGRLRVIVDNTAKAPARRTARA